jgi:hypothetical protein
VSAGELVDRLTILEIKVSEIRDARQGALRGQLRAACRARDRLLFGSPRLNWLTAELRAVNRRLWSVEEQLREYERRADFGDQFIELARSVYRHNDRRAALKRAVDELSRSETVETKSYPLPELESATAGAESGDRL